MRFLSILFLAILSGPALAGCPRHGFSDPSRMRLGGDTLLIVTHASTNFDARASTKRGLDDAVRFAKERKVPVVYLQDDSPEHLYFMDDCSPDHWVSSQDGEVRFDVRASQLYVAGGHLELCLSTTLHDVLAIWARQPRRSRTITYFMDAIYSNGKSIDASAPYYSDFERFMGVVTHGRPGGEQWPKLTLLETMGIIKKETHEFEYLKSVLPHYARTIPAEYRVELQMNDSVAKVIRPAAGWNPPTLRFHFVDSAPTLAESVGR
jgi:hypothetical protein